MRHLPLAMQAQEILPDGLIVSLSVVKKLEALSYGG
jgi:hypothetical protein